MSREQKRLRRQQMGPTSRERRQLRIAAGGVLSAEVMIEESTVQLIAAAVQRLILLSKSSCPSLLFALSLDWKVV